MYYMIIAIIYGKVGMEMLQFYNNLNISKKLNFMNLSTAIIAGIVAILFIVLYQYIDSTKTMKYQSRTFSKVIAQNIAPAILFKESKNIQDSLSSLKCAKDILEAYALDEHGKLLGIYVRIEPYKENESIKKLKLKEQQFWKGSALYTVTPVVVDGKNIGYLVLVHSMDRFIVHLFIPNYAIEI